MNLKKVCLIGFAALTLSASVLAATEPASAWWRGGGYRGGWGGYRGGWGGGGYGYGGFSTGVLTGLAVGGLAGAALAAPAYGYPAYGCVQHPTYDAWGNFVGYSC